MSTITVPSKKKTKFKNAIFTYIEPCMGHEVEVYKSTKKDQKEMFESMYQLMFEGTSYLDELASLKNIEEVIEEFKEEGLKNSDTYNWYTVKDVKDLLKIVQEKDPYKLAKWYEKISDANEYFEHEYAPFSFEYQ
jgi:hypothetical protein